MIESTLEISTFEILIIFLFGYLLLRYITTKEKFNEFHELDKIIFASIIGISIYLFLKDMILYNISQYLFYILDPFKSKECIEELSLTYIRLIFTVSLIFLLVRELSNLLSSKKIDDLKEILYLLFNLLRAGSIIAIIITIVSSFTILDVLTTKLVLYTIYLILITCFTYLLYYIIQNSSNLDKPIQLSDKLIQKITEIKNKYFLGKKYIVLLLTTFIIIVFFTKYPFFPDIYYNPEIVTNYAFDIDSLILTNDTIDKRDVYFFEKVEQPIIITQKGWLGWLPIKNEGILISDTFRSGLKDLRSEALEVKLKSGYYYEFSGITDISYNNEYNSFILKFDKLNLSDIKEIKYSGYRPINLNKTNIGINIDVNSPKNKIQLNITNNLDKQLVLFGDKRIILKDLHKNYNCSLSFSELEIYNSKENIIKSSSRLPGNNINTSIRFDLRFNEEKNNNEVNLEIAGDSTSKYIILSNLKINPYTILRVNVYFDCK